MQEVFIKYEFIKLGQLLKLAGLVQNGNDAKYAVADGLVSVNGEVCLMRGKKIFPGDNVSFEGEEVTVKSAY
ncbi:MAG: RNA-binding S4 domain-containing protein [Lachnospiraceae bacterium]|nr:RNA-binding S4 domain-containing protein [Lachnospiraceae bacterium]